MFVQPSLANSSARRGVIGIGLPDPKNAARARNRRQTQIGNDPARSGQRVGLQKLVQQRGRDFDVPDAGAGPAFERIPVAGAVRGVLMEREGHPR
jgi:hypothetical protein